MNDIYTSHPTDSLTLVKQVIDEYRTKKGKEPKHLVIPKWMLSSLKEMTPSDEPFEITTICGVPVSSSEETIVLGKS